MTVERPNEDGGPRMRFVEHLAELRSRLVKGLIGVAVGFAVAYGFSERLFRLLMIPYDDAYRSVFGRAPVLITTTLFESFLVYLKVGIFGGVLLASPYLFYQVWAFAAPALRPNERRHVIPVVTLATLFFLGGACFGYFGVFPVGFRYFLSVAPSEYIQPMLRMQEYFQVGAGMMVVFGLVFEGPMLVLYLAYLGWVKPRHLLRPWRGIVLGIAIASAVLTPADAGSMIMMMAPLLLLYGITILVSLFLARTRPR